MMPVAVRNGPLHPAPNLQGSQGGAPGGRRVHVSPHGAPKFCHPELVFDDFTASFGFWMAARPSASLPFHTCYFPKKQRFAGQLVWPCDAISSPNLQMPLLLLLERSAMDTHALRLLCAISFFRTRRMASASIYCGRGSESSINYTRRHV